MGSTLHGRRASGRRRRTRTPRRGTSVRPANACLPDSGRPLSCSRLGTRAWAAPSVTDAPRPPVVRTCSVMPNQSGYPSNRRCADDVARPCPRSSPCRCTLLPPPPSVHEQALSIHILTRWSCLTRVGERKIQYGDLLLMLNSKSNPALAMAKCSIDDSVAAPQCVRPGAMAGWAERADAGGVEGARGCGAPDARRRGAASQRFFTDAAACRAANFNAGGGGLTPSPVPSFLNVVHDQLETVRRDTHTQMRTWDHTDGAGKGHRL